VEICNNSLQGVLIFIYSYYQVTWVIFLVLYVLGLIIISYSIVCSDVVMCALFISRY